MKAACKAKAKAEAKKKADAAGVPAKAAIPPLPVRSHFKGLGCACDETTRKQVTCRFGKGPGSTKAIRYGPGMGLTSKQALVKGEGSARSFLAGVPPRCSIRTDHVGETNTTQHKPQTQHNDSVRGAVCAAGEPCSGRARAVLGQNYSPALKSSTNRF